MLVICLLVVILDNTILNVALRRSRRISDASQSQMQWAVDSYALVFAGLLITGGVLGDRLGRKKVLLFGMLAFGADVRAVLVRAHSSTQLILFRGADGHRRRRRATADAVDHPERLRAARARQGDRHLGRRVRRGDRARPDHRRPAAEVLLVGLDLPGQRADRDRRRRSRSSSSCRTRRTRDPGRLDPAGVLLSIVALVVLVYGVIEGGNSNDWLAWNTAGRDRARPRAAGAVRLDCRRAAPTRPSTCSLFKNRHFSAGAAVDRR